MSRGEGEDKRDEKKLKGKKRCRASTNKTQQVE